MTYDHTESRLGVKRIGGELFSTLSKCGKKIGRPRTTSASTKACPKCHIEFSCEDKRQIYCSAQCWRSTPEFIVACTKERKKKAPSEIFKSKILIVPTGCWEWQGFVKKNGYGSFTTPGFRYAHRFAYVLFKGPIPEGINVCHTCDNRKCVNPEHLWLGTQAENISDCIEKGRRNYQPAAPEKRKRSIDFQKAKEVKKDILSGNLTIKELHEKHGFSRNHIANIKNGARWADVY